MQAYAVYFDTEIMKMIAEVVNFSSDNDDLLNDEICRYLNAKGYDFLDYSDEITILVDDEGLFKKGLPVFEVESSYGDISRLVGKMLFLRNIENEDSTNIGSITPEDIYKLRDGMNIKFIGLTKGVE